jgi:hypothetical protein
MEISHVLGYINRYIEEYGTKVIIVANENEIGKLNFDRNVELKYLVAANNSIAIPKKAGPFERAFNSSDNKNNVNADKLPIDLEELKHRSSEVFSDHILYKQIKEKVIGQEIQFIPDLKTVLPNFVNKLKTSDCVIEYINGNISEVAEFLYEVKHANLRTVKFALDIFKEIYDIVENKEIHEDNYYQLFKSCILTSVFYKKGLRLESIKYMDYATDKEYGNINIYDAFNIDPFKKRTDFSLFFKFIGEMVYKSDINADRIKIVFLNYCELQDLNASNPDDPFLKIKYWSDYTDIEINKSIEEFFLKLRYNRYSLNLYGSILSSFSQLIEIGFSKDFLSETVKCFKDNLPKFDYNTNVFKDINSYYNRPLDDKNDYYKKAFDELHSYENEIYAKRTKNNYDEIFISPDWGRKLFEQVKNRFESSSLTEEENFLHQLGAEYIVGVLIKSNRDNILDFITALDYYYLKTNRGSERYDNYDLHQLKDTLNNSFDTPDNGIDRIKRYNLSFVIKAVNVILSEYKQDVTEKSIETVMT